MKFWGGQHTSLFVIPGWTAGGVSALWVSEDPPRRTHIYIFFQIFCISQFPPVKSLPLRVEGGQDYLKYAVLAKVVGIRVPQKFVGTPVVTKIRGNSRPKEGLWEHQF